MFEQRFDQLKTDQDQIAKAELNPSSRSIIRPEDSDCLPILDGAQHYLAPPRRVVDLIVDNQRVPRVNNQLNTTLHGPKYGSKLPVVSNIDDSPHVQNEDSLNAIVEPGFCNEVWRKKPLEIFIIVLRFISFITKANFSTSFRLINHNVFAIIGDKSANYRYYLFNNYFKYEKPTHYQSIKYLINQRFLVPLRRIRLYQYFHKHKLLLRPESVLAIGWNIYILSILNMNVLYVSTRVAFQMDAVELGDDFYQFRYIVFDVLPSYSFILEIMLKFNTCYYNKGNLIENRFLIARKYLRSSFFFDVFVIIPFFLSLRFQVDYLDLVLILKVFQIQKFSGTLFDRLELSSSQIALFDLIKLCYTILAAAHFCACLWFLVGRTGDPNQMSWIRYEGIEDDLWVNQYFHSFYYSIVTMTTIGYGDITPKNLRERIFTIGMAVAACGIFGYSIGNISNIFAEWSRRSYQFRTDMNNLKKYMRIKGINKQLAEKVRKYFEYVWSDLNEENDKEAFKFTEQIPEQLMEEMKIDINIKIVKRINFLVDNFSEGFLIQLSKSMTEEKCGPDQIIFNQNDSSDYMYILEKGSIQYYIELNHKTGQQQMLETISGTGMAFGQLEFFQNQPYAMSCKSTHFSYILKISRTELVELLKANPEDYQKYCQMKDQLQFCGSQEAIQLYCRACNKPQHIIKECPMVCGYPNRAKVLLNYRRNIPSDRVGGHARKPHKSIRTLTTLPSLRDSVHLYLCMEPDSIMEVDEVIYRDDDSISQSQISRLVSPIKAHSKSKGVLSFNACEVLLQDPGMQQKMKAMAAQLRIISLRNNDTSIGFLKPEYSEIKRNNDELISGRARRNSAISQNSPLVQNEEYSAPRQLTVRINNNEPSIVQLSPELNNNRTFFNKDEVEEQDESGKIRGQYKELFDRFEKAKNFNCYLKHNNCKSIQEILNKRCPTVKIMKHSQMVRHSKRVVQ